MNGILADFVDNQSLGLEKRNPAAFGWSLGAVVVVMAFCSLIVGIDAWRVSLYDEETLDKLMMHLHHCNNTLLMHLPEPETIYRMAQRKCENIRQRFRSRSGTPVKAPEVVEVKEAPDLGKLLAKEEDEVLVVYKNRVEVEELGVEKNEDNVDVGGGIIPGDNNQETVLTDSSNEVSDHSNDLTDPDSGLRNRGQRMKE